MLDLSEVYAAEGSAVRLLANLPLERCQLAQAATVIQEDFVRVCPLDLPGTISRSSVTADGVVVTFETSLATAVAELRERAAELATLVSRAAAEPAGDQRLPVLFTADYQESRNGASLLLKPMNAADLEKLQTTIAGKIDSMNLTHRCYQLANVN
jgi:hypothetical protein